MWVGPVVILLVMFVIGPFLLFAAGALISAIYGWLFVATVDEDAGIPEAVDA